MFDFINLPWGF